MPSLGRRAFLAGSSTILFATSGCSAPRSAPTPAHWVTVYLAERDETHDVTVTVTNGTAETLFEQEYHLSDSNEADEHAPFPASTEPETIVVIVDDTRFERDWPGFENPNLPCEDPNWAGIEVWIENDEAGDPGVRFEADCQHVTMG
ncbi:Uncharacterized protein HSRCO_0054 [Halanaeroarchaeum sp. HSR-CO]|uniref:hypothetical protein n=1 Tax=Halanaeroarchaeum sp. HSR-CO TaxID=2866382 RepID=UPI00217EAD82|nr:hypothetical protein [Halanaeroarchaeum sp. HSR-CO]UWG46356.1 Uncharacterized protein HSRCO_0054 [Halanaeroarchaeum sp. HSR-CO]